MRCLYEVLGVEKTAESAEIKMAYRKQAIKWHPDKNPDNAAEAEERFQEIINAYEVLSDPHERSWYDNHRDAILRSGERHQAGGSAGVGGSEEPEEEIIDLYAYFSSSCYKGYGNDAKGFYAVYTEAFGLVAETERNCGSESTPPPFGNDLSDWGDVKAFFDYWSNFCTVREFGWKEPYNLASAPNRKVRRLMEEENKKVKKQAKKEFNDLVRDLAAFAKKRDRRVQRRQREVKEAKSEKKREEEERIRLEKEERMRKAEEYVDHFVEDVQAWQIEEEEEEEEVDPSYCVICSKRFKSIGQLRNHEKSKKHKEQLKKMRRFLEEEERAMGATAAAPAAREELACILVDQDRHHEGEGEEAEAGDVAEAKRQEAEAEVPPRPREAAPPSPPPNEGKKAKKKNKTQLRKERKLAAKREAEENKKIAALKCSTCGVVFDSRNKLFAHLKKECTPALKSV